MSADDEDLLTDLSAAYCDAVIGQGHKPPLELLKQVTSVEMRDRLLEEMSLIAGFFELTRSPRERAGAARG